MDRWKKIIASKGDYLEGYTPYHSEFVNSAKLFIYYLIYYLYIFTLLDINIEFKISY